jgi:hypothetical protein
MSVVLMLIMLSGVKILSSGVKDISTVGKEIICKIHIRVQYFRHGGLLTYSFKEDIFENLEK